MFQSSFELTGYITQYLVLSIGILALFQSSFELTGYITKIKELRAVDNVVSKLFRAYGLYNYNYMEVNLC